jgi:hypothetical protein
MALIVEDGTGLANAESYVSVADATTYHANIGNTAWAVYRQSLRDITLQAGFPFDVIFPVIP